MHLGAPQLAKKGTMQAEKGHFICKFVKCGMGWGHVHSVPPVSTSMCTIRLLVICGL